MKTGTSFWTSVFFFVLVTSGCAVTPVRAPVGDVTSTWLERQEKLSALTAWDISARFALRTAEEGVQATLRWSRRADHQTLELAGPFGSGHVRLTEGPLGAQLLDANKKSYYADNPEELLYRITGWELPIGHLDYWVRGLPAPDTSVRYDLDDYGRLSRLQQSGWEVQFLAYTEYKGHELPNRLFAKRAEDPMTANILPAVEARIVIQQFRIAAE